MYDIIKNVIISKNYELSDILMKIDTFWLQGDITEEQRAELISLARQNATPEMSYAPLQKQVDTLFENVSELAASVLDLQSRVTVLEGTEPEPTPEPEKYPEYVQPTGAHDAYNTGDKITYNGKKYVCQMDGCVWTPDAYPAGWQLVEDGTEDTEEPTEPTE